MNKTKLQLLWKRKIIILFSVIISFFIGFLTTSIISHYQSYITCDFETTISINGNDLITYNNLNNIKNSAEKYQNINVKQLIDNNDFKLTKNNDIYTITTPYYYYDEFFLSSQNNVSTRGKKFIEDFLSTYIGRNNIYYLDANIIQINNTYSPYLGGLYALLFGLVISTTLSLLIKEKDSQNEDDILKTSLFKKNYWINSCAFFKDIRSLSVISMLFALMLVSKLIILPSGFANLGLSFGFLFFAIITSLYGPIAGLTIGFLSDTIGFFLFDNSGTGFFIGYVIQAMLTGFIYGLFLYHSKISFFKILIMRLIIGLLCNVVIGGLSWGFVANYNLEQTFYYMLLFSLPKNLIYLIPQSLLLFLVIKLTMPLFSRLNLIDKKIAKNIKII